MKNQIIIFMKIFVLALFFSNCSKSKDDICEYEAMPNSLGLRITKSGTVVPDLDLLNVKLSYFENNEKKYVSDFSINNIELNNRDKGYISSRIIGILSAKNNIKTYYLEYPNGWQTDTIYVDYLLNTLATNCQYVLNPIKLNNISATVYVTADFGGKPVYEINKP